MTRTSARVLALMVAPVVAVALSVRPAVAQAPAPPDFSKVEIQATQLAPNFYRFEAVGPALVGNTGILTGPDGIFMVDAAFPQLYDKLTAAIKKASPDGKVRFLVNGWVPEHIGAQRHRLRQDASGEIPRVEAGTDAQQ